LSFVEDVTNILVCFFRFTKYRPTKQAVTTLSPTSLRISAVSTTYWCFMW